MKHGTPSIWSRGVAGVQMAGVLASIVAVLRYREELALFVPTNLLLALLVLQGLRVIPGVAGSGKVSLFARRFRASPQASTTTETPAHGSQMTAQPEPFVRDLSLESVGSETPPAEEVSPTRPPTIPQGQYSREVMRKLRQDPFARLARNQSRKG